jgi:hypothetical protein
MKNRQKIENAGFEADSGGVGCRAEMPSSGNKR